MKLHFRPSRRRRQQGSTLVLAVTICGLGTLGVVATASIIQARGLEAEQTQKYTERWTRLQNSKALARQVLHHKYVTSDRGPTSLETYSLPDGWGEIGVQAFSDAALEATATRLNKTGAVPTEAYSQDVEVGISDGTMQYEYQFEIKSANAMLNGELLTVHKPLIGGGSPEVLGDIRVKGRTRIFSVGTELTGDTIKSDEFLGLGNGTYKPTFVDTSGTSVKPLNFSFATRGSTVVDGNPAFDGRVSIIENDDTPQNAYLNRIKTTGLTVQFDGDLPFAKGIGADTRVPTLNDVIQLALITAGGVWSDIGDTLIKAGALSSDVLTALLGADPPAGVLEQILEANAPLPNDVLALVLESDILSAAQKEAILVDSPVIARSDGAGNVIILPIADIAAHIHVTNARSVIFEGSTDATALAASELLSGLVVVIQQKTADSNQLQEVEFNEENRRRLIVAIQRETVGDLSLPVGGGKAFPEWRMLLEMESTRANFDVSPVAGLNLEGGIRTDQRLQVSGGTLTLKQEEDPGNLALLASRDAWIEEFRK